MLSQIEAVSDDPDAAELVRSGAQFAAAVEFALRLRIMAHEIDSMAPRGIARRRSRPPGLILMPFIVPMLQQREEEGESRQRALSERALSQLPEIIYTETTMEQFGLTDGDPACAICCEDHTPGKRLLQLPCKHLFCLDCGQEWLRRSCTCPVCRTEVPDEEEESESDDQNEWNVDDLFPMRLAQGSPMAAVRRAREAQESGMQFEQLWPPADEAPLQSTDRQSRPRRAPADHRSEQFQQRRLLFETSGSRSAFGSRQEPRSISLGRILSAELQTGPARGFSASVQHDEARVNRRREASMPTASNSRSAAQDEAQDARPHASSQRTQSNARSSGTPSVPPPADGSASSRSQFSVARAIRGRTRAMMRMFGSGTRST